MRNWLKLFVATGFAAFFIGVWVFYRLSNTDTGIEAFGATILREKWPRDRVVRESKKWGLPGWNDEKNELYISQPATHGFVIEFHGVDSLEVTFGSDGKVASTKFEFQCLAL